MKRSAQAKWQGDLRTGLGSISTASGVLSDVAYSFHSRFEQGKGTNPEELIAAAHAGCFAMALSNELGQAGITPKKLEATAAITLEAGAGGFSITKSHIDLVAEIPGVDKAKFETAVKSAEKNCPVSKLLKAEISVTSKLV